MRRNNRRLYESIMRDVSKIVKQHLNEDLFNDLHDIEDQKNLDSEFVDELYGKIISKYQKGDDIDKIIDEFEDNYNIFLYTKNGKYKTIFSLSTITFSITLYRWENDWSEFDKYGSREAARDYIVEYLVASNLHNGSFGVAEALNKSDIGWTNWESLKIKNKKLVIKIKCSEGYILEVWKK